MIVNQALRPLEQHEREALRRSIAEHGQQVPIVRQASTGQLIDGHHRMDLCVELGCDPIVMDLDVDDDTAEALRITLNTARRQMSRAEIRSFQPKLIRDIYATTPALGRGRKGKALAVAKETGKRLAASTGLPLEAVTPTSAEVIEAVTGEPPQPIVERSRGPRGPRVPPAVMPKNDQDLPARTERGTDLLDATKTQLLARMCELANCTPLRLGQALVAKYTPARPAPARSRDVQPEFKKSKT